MEASIFLLKPSNGKKSTLDKAYQKHIESVLRNLTEEEESRWETYSVIIEQLLEQGKDAYFKEMKYRLTDGENPNEIILDILNRESDNLDNLGYVFKRRIEEYLEEDFFKRFSR